MFGDFWLLQMPTTSDWPFLQHPCNLGPTSPVSQALNVFASDMSLTGIVAPDVEPMPPKLDGARRGEEVERKSFN